MLTAHSYSYSYVCSIAALLVTLYRSCEKSVELGTTKRLHVIVIRVQCVLYMYTVLYI